MVTEECGWSLILSFDDRVAVNAYIARRPHLGFGFRTVPHINVFSLALIRSPLG
jgi:hypothetical protein